MKDLILTLIKTPKEELTLDFLKKAKRAYASAKKMSTVPSNIQLLRSYHELLKSGEIEKMESLENVMKKRPVRSMS